MIHWRQVRIAAATLAVTGSVLAQSSAQTPGSLPAGHPPVSKTKTSTSAPAGAAKTQGKLDAEAKAKAQTEPRAPSKTEAPGTPANAKSKAKAPETDAETPPETAGANDDLDQDSKRQGAAHSELFRAPQDTAVPSKAVPEGTIVAQVLDQNGKPRPNIEVRLGILFQTIAQGERRQHRTQQTDSEGRVRFSGLESSSSYSYRVSVPSGAAEYASPPFNLREGMGQKVQLHVYPVTRSLKEALIGTRALVYIQPRDDVFQFEIQLRVFNMGAVTWVPDNAIIDLPSGANAFVTPDSMSDTRLVKDGNEARLVGTFSPGQHDVSMRFQVPSDKSATEDFDLTLLPNVAEAIVASEASSSMELKVDGFPSARVSKSQRGERVLVTSRALSRAEPAISDIDIHLTGIPVPGNAPWIAVGLAALLAAAGIWSRLSDQRATEDRELADSTLQQARERLLEELVALEQAFAGGQIGPRTHERARRRMLNALARLEAQELSHKAETMASPGIAEGSVAG